MTGDKKACTYRKGSEHTPSHLPPTKQHEQTTDSGPSGQAHSTSARYADRRDGFTTTTSTPSGFSETDTDPSGLETTTTRDILCLHSWVGGTVLDFGGAA